MSSAAEELRLYCVELDVEATAVVTIAASSSDEACDRAEKACRAVDVTQVAAVSVSRVVEVEAVGGELKRAARARRRETASKGRRDRGQA